MFRVRYLLLAAFLVCFPALVPATQGAAKPTDSQIAHIANTAGQIDIEAGQQALQKSQSTEVKNFADAMVRDHTAINKRASELLDKLKLKAEPNKTSASLMRAASKAKKRLSKLQGASFDRAYARNEVAFHKKVNATLEKKLIPKAQNGELKDFLEDGLTLFREHLRQAEQLVKTLTSTSTKRPD